MSKNEILQKLVKNFEVRGRSHMTIKDYKAKVRLFQVYYDRPSDQLREDEINSYLHYLATAKKSNPSAVNTYNSALRFLYWVTLDTTLNYKKLPRMKQNAG